MFGAVGISGEVISACEVIHEVYEVEVGAQFGDAIVFDIEFFVVDASKEYTIALSMLVSNKLVEVSDKGLSGSLMTALLSEKAGVLCGDSENSDLSIHEDSLCAWLIDRGDR